jgi:hypothetical protein
MGENVETSLKEIRFEKMHRIHCVLWAKCITEILLLLLLFYYIFSPLICPTNKD